MRRTIALPCLGLLLAAAGPGWAQAQPESQPGVTRPAREGKEGVTRPGPETVSPAGGAKGKGGSAAPT